MILKPLKILYAVQATGNGHIARAIELYPHLKKYGQVDFFLSGSNASLHPEIPIKYRSTGLSLFYRNNGKLNYLKILFQSNPIKIYKHAKKLPVQEYDLVISDFEFITYLACKINKKPFFHLGHQASFYSAKTPRPAKSSFLANWILKNYCRSNWNIGFHFHPYEPWILPPIIKKDLWKSISLHNSEKAKSSAESNALVSEQSHVESVQSHAKSEPSNLTTEQSHEVSAPNHDFSYEIFNPNSLKKTTFERKLNEPHKITVYLPQYSTEEIRRFFYGIHHVQFHIFHSSVTQNHTEGDIHWKPINNEIFAQSMIESHGIVCGAGFETPAEALFLEKELLVIPITGQYEQYCNAESLKEMGVTVVDRLDLNFYDAFNRWLKTPRNKNLKPNFLPTNQIVDSIFNDFILPRL